MRPTAVPAQAPTTPAPTAPSPTAPSLTAPSPTAPGPLPSTATPSSPDPADSAPDEAPTPQVAEDAAAPSRLPSERDRHLLSRFSFGVTEELVADSHAAGGARKWFDDQLDQLDQASGPDERTDSLRLWWPHLWWSTQKIDEADASGEITGGELQADFARWTLLQRIYAHGQVLEVMADMWSNLLHVPAPLNKTFRHRVSYDAMIRDHALGRFDHLLIAAETHPAMLCYLDNARSTAKAPNENLGRELLELHTVGREADFTEADVHDSAMILTGWRVDLHDTWDPYYSRKDHYVGRVKVMGFSHPNASADGREVTTAYLRYLATHPATARRICERLAVRFVRDDPTERLVDAMVDAYLDSGTGIKPTLRAMVDHPDFGTAAGEKVRTPAEDLVNTYRVMGVDIDPPSGRSGNAADSVLTQAQTMGQRPFDWGPPDGFPDVAPAWSSASRMLGCWKVHRNTAGGYYPRVGITYVPISRWLPDLPAPFDEVVDEVCQQLLARAASPGLVDAASHATGIGKNDTVTRDSVLVTHRMPQLLNAVLDSPEHMTR